jgi:release factor glutamine methyltransferase
MNVRDALREGVAALGGSDTPFLDASLLLAHALDLEPGALYSSWPEPVAEGALDMYRASLNERASGWPVAYLVGRKEFWGRIFKVDRRVLVPRPDTETLVASALEAGADLERGTDPGRKDIESNPIRVHEACCGSGCVAISIAAEKPHWLVSASDISAEALAVARENADALLDGNRAGGGLELERSDLLDSVEGPFDLIVANPPYLRKEEAEDLASSLSREPRLALDGGPDGLDLFRRLIPQAAARLTPGGLLVLEADPSQMAELLSLLAIAGFEGHRVRRDLSDRDRVAEGRIPWKR